MTLEEAANNIGRTVTYTPDRYEHAPDGIEHGVITATTGRYVFVRYGTDQHAKATAPSQLELVADGP